MARSTFVALRDVDDDLVRVQARIADALDKLAAAIPAAPTRFYSTTIFGRNGAGYLTLLPRKDPNKVVTSRVQVGDSVVQAWNVTDNVDMIAGKQVETVITKTDQIRQLSAANLTAKTLLLTVVGP